MGQCNAQMAELVDALVSNTNEVTLVPVRLRLWVQRDVYRQPFFLSIFLGKIFSTNTTKIARPQNLFMFSIFAEGSTYFQLPF